MTKLNRKLLYIRILIPIFFIVLLQLSTPVLAKETVKISGAKIQYQTNNDLLLIFGDAQVMTEEATIRADHIETIFKDGEALEIKAIGNVQIVKKEDTFYGEELTYHLKKKTGLILEISAQFDLEKSDENVYIKGKKADYSSDLIDIVGGSFTSCDLDHPHYLFRASRLKIYPEDKITAYHVTFWEFNGTIPLFYWPYYSIPLKDKKNKLTPNIGHSALTGWFFKTIYSYYTEGDQHGELYTDYYQKLGLAGGVKHYYMDDDYNKGFVYFYLRKQDENKTVPYLALQHSQNYRWNNWRFTTNTSINRYGYRDTISNNDSIYYSNKGNTLNWNLNYTANQNYTDLYESKILKNTLKVNYKLGDIKIYGDLKDTRYFHQPDNNIWHGLLRLSQYKPLYEWKLFVQKKGNKNPDYNFYTLPELEFKLKFAALDIPLKPYISPFTYTLNVGHYIENRSETKEYRVLNKLNFSKSISLIGPLKLVTRAEGKFGIFSTWDYYYSYKPEVELKTNPIHGFSSSLKYSYQNGEGTSPFYFDKPITSETHKLTGRLSYIKSGLNITTSTGYNLVTKQFDTLYNSLTYNWDKNRIRFSVPYYIEQQKFSDLTGSIKVKADDFTFNLDTKVNPNEWEFKKFSTALDWQVDDNWHLNLNASFDPLKGFDVNDSKTKGIVKVLRDLHCREISLSYDLVKKEIWFQYQIKAFPEDKFRLGSNENDPLLLDMNLGGMSVGK